MDLRESWMIWKRGHERNHMQGWEQTDSGVTAWLKRVARSGDGIVD